MQGHLPAVVDGRSLGGLEGVLERKMCIVSAVSGWDKTDWKWGSVTTGVNVGLSRMGSGPQEC